ncbi:EamA family transporter [Vogesella sp. LYT16W]|nr:EamA family transporter [Vogesella indigofera]MDC7706753.1 EamA family transporter [Vogesella indigofera]
MTIAANLMLKIGAERYNGNLAELLNIKIFFGLAFFGMAAFFYILILTKIPLNVAQSFATIQFIAVIMAAHFFLGEPIDATRALGIFLIFCGILLVGKSSF